jgi:urease accessory protein
MPLPCSLAAVTRNPGKEHRESGRTPRISLRFIRATLLRYLSVLSPFTELLAPIPPQLALHFACDPTRRTFLARQFVTYPFFLTQPFYLDDTLPGMPSLILQSVSGGLYQDERLAVSVTADVGAQVHCTTQSATVVHSMAEHRHASQMVTISAAAGTFVEYLPGPMILFPHANLRTTLDIVLDPSATVIVGEAFLVHDPAAQGQKFGSLISETSVRCPDGRLLCRDRVRMSGDERTVNAPGVLHHFQAQGTIWVLSSSSTREVLEELRTALNGVSGLYAGASTLPNQVGVWARLLASDALVLNRGLQAVWSAVRRVLTGQGVEGRRKVGWL